MKPYLWVFALLVCLSCRSDSQPQDQGTPVSGTFTIYTDETYYPLVQVLAEGFMSVYPTSNISIDTSGSGNVYARLSGNGIRAIITCQEISTVDSTALAQRKIFPKIFHFATDAIAVISKAKTNNGTSFVMKGDMSSCLENSLSPIAEKIITDRPGSENNGFLKTRYATAGDCMKNWLAAGNQKAVIDVVSQNEKQIGLVGWSYLSDKDDPEMMSRRALINIIPFSVDTTLIYPSQSAIITGTYPLSRKIYLVTAEPHTGPATGFASYVASSEGQRIIRMIGLAPANTPPREIYIHQ